MTEKTPEPVDVPEALFTAASLRQARDMPWKAGNEIRRWLILPLAWLTLRGIEIGAGWRFYGLPVFQRHRRSQIRIGRGLNLRSTARSNPLAPNHAVVISTRRAGAKLTIGDDFGMTGGSLVCDERITIGDRVWAGANAVITDTDFHPLDPQLRRDRPLDAKTAPVEIADDVFIGMNALILKGVRIGAAGGGWRRQRRQPPTSRRAASSPAIRRASLARRALLLVNQVIAQQDRIAQGDEIAGAQARPRGDLLSVHARSVGAAQIVEPKGPDRAG